MSIAESVDQLRERLPARLRPAYDNVIAYLSRAPHDYLARTLERAILQEPVDFSECEALLDELERVTRRFFRPLATQEGAYEKDMETWFWLMRNFLEVHSAEGVRDNMHFFFALFDPAGKTLCGALRSRCKRAGNRAYTGDEACMHRFTRDENAEDVVLCPNCGTPRTLCIQSPYETGYCRFHGGRPRYVTHGTEDDDAPLLRGEAIYGIQLTGKMRKYYRQFQKDPDFLSAVPEINLLRAHITDNLEKLEEFDVSIVERGMDKALDRLEEALDDDDMEQAYNAKEELRAWLEQGRSGDRRWSGVLQDMGITLRALETERKRVVDAKQMIMRQEVNILIEDLIQEVRALIGNRFPDLIARIITDNLRNWFPVEAPRIIRRMGDSNFEQRIGEALLLELSRSLVRAEEADAKNQLREEIAVLASGMEEALEGEFEGEDDGIH